MREMKNCLLSVCAAVGVVAMCQGTQTARPILVYNEDDSVYAYSGTPYGPYGATLDEAGLRNYLRRIAAGGKVTHFFMNPNAQNCNWNSKVMSPEWAWENRPGTWKTLPFQRNLKKLHDAGIDMYAIWTDEARKLGVSPWLSIRMNDCHFMDEPNHAIHSDFWIAHREFRRKPESNGANWHDFALDYAHKEVREYFIRFIEEALGRYDIDGIELDWMRAPDQLTPGKEPELSWCLDEVVKATRGFADDAAKRLGHPVRVGVRIPTRPEEARKRGMDFLSWAKNGWVDWIVPCNYYFSCDFNLPYAKWVKVVGAVNPKVMVVPGTDCYVRDPKKREMRLEEYAVFADRMYKQGAPGVYIFNLFCHPPTNGVWKAVITEGLPPDLVARRAQGVKVTNDHD